MSTWLLVTSMVQAGGAGQGQINNLTVRLKNRSKTQKLIVPPGPTPQWPGGIPSECTAVFGFVKPPKSQSEWLIRRHGAFEINRQDSGMSSKKPRLATTKFGSISATSVRRWLQGHGSRATANETILVSQLQRAEAATHTKGCDRSLSRAFTLQLERKTWDNIFSE